MLQLLDAYSQMNMPQVLAVYEESNLRFGAEVCAAGSRWEQLRLGEENLRDYFRDFFRQKGACLATWTGDGQVVSVARLEPLDDGLLLTGLETLPAFRGRGYATMLLTETCRRFRRIYSHVRKDNLPSLAVHKKAGFTVTQTFAKLLDGSVSHAYVTLESAPD